MSTIADGIARIEYCTAADLRKALQVPEIFPRQEFSLTDCTSWALMERLGIAVALSLDADFRVYRYGPQRDRYFTVHP